MVWLLQKIGREYLPMVSSGERPRLPDSILSSTMELLVNVLDSHSRKSLPKNPHPQAALFGRWEVGGRGSESKG